MDSDSFRADFPSGARGGSDRENDPEGGHLPLEEFEDAEAGDGHPAVLETPRPRRNTLGNLPNEITEIVDADVKFEAFGRAQIWDSAMALVRYRVPRLERFLAADDKAREYLPDAIRKPWEIPFRDIALILKLNKHTFAQTTKKVRGEYQVRRARYSSPPIDLLTQPAHLRSIYPTRAGNGQLG